MKNIDDNFNGLLIYLLDNCICAYDELCRINNELNKEWRKVQGKDFSSNIDLKHLGEIHRMIQDYLIIRVHGLFDKTEHVVSGGVDEVVSFEKLFSNNQDFQKIKEQEIIKYIIAERHNFVAHMNKKFVVPDSSKICNSNLKEILLRLRALVS